MVVSGVRGFPGVVVRFQTEPILPFRQQLGANGEVKVRVRGSWGEVRVGDVSGCFGEGVGAGVAFVASMALDPGWQDGSVGA